MLDLLARGNEMINVRDWKECSSFGDCFDVSVMSRTGLDVCKRACGYFGSIRLPSVRTYEARDMDSVREYSKQMEFD